ncbi:MAG TPA: hypothetical protein VHM19_03840 [Polyangiales bacterium]|jgi:hypothetical protein|nr:hypothetical protein [Polyangiales bacterium]
MARIATVALALALLVLGARSAHAEPRPGDPLAYDLRIAVFPATFQAGISQSSFGSALRAEYRVVRRFDLGVLARAGWWNVTGEDKHHGYTLGVNATIHLSEAIDERKLGGTVYPEDPGAVGGTGSAGGTDHDLEVPTSSRLGGPRMGVDNPNRDTVALMYSVTSLRVGFSYASAIEPAQSSLGASDYVQARMPLVHLGFGWGTHWNLPAEVTGQPEIGYRRFYLDVLGTAPSLVKERALFSTPDVAHPKIFPLGGRIGMEGSIDALLHDAPGVGFGYTLELGALPARRSVEGYLFVGLGVALDFATR